MKKTLTVLTLLLLVSMASIAQKVEVSYTYNYKDTTVTFEIVTLDDLPYVTREAVMEVYTKRNTHIKIYRDGIITIYNITYNRGSKVYHIWNSDGGHLFESTKITKIRSYLWHPVQIGLVKI